MFTLKVPLKDKTEKKIGGKRDSFGVLGKDSCEALEMVHDSRS
jgi:hypothetical protein